MLYGPYIFRSNQPIPNASETSWWLQIVVASRQRLYAERHPMRRTPAINFFARMTGNRVPFKDLPERERSAGLWTSKRMCYIRYRRFQVWSDESASVRVPVPASGGFSEKRNTSVTCSNQH
ncbi:hypothetical protein AVEN_137217-1 [Araneus ventricosus]|uniref:Uncharacterized protein n=1 Tax=Araneus ventricosus TaxID=182803 RepID=A0A4Y2ISY8_ARAVE|nr:hypothetical protein AVEN_137217-1 [Araneus ventricosus]